MSGTCLPSSQTASSLRAGARSDSYLPFQCPAQVLAKSKRSVEAGKMKVLRLWLYTSQSQVQPFSLHLSCLSLLLVQDQVLSPSGTSSGQFCWGPWGSSQVSLCRMGMLFSYHFSLRAMGHQPSQIIWCICDIIWSWEAVLSPSLYSLYEDIEAQRG